MFSRRKLVSLRAPLAKQIDCCSFTAATTQSKTKNFSALVDGACCCPVTAKQQRAGRGKRLGTTTSKEAAARSTACCPKQSQHSGCCQLGEVPPSVASQACPPCLATRAWPLKAARRSRHSGASLENAGGHVFLVSLSFFFKHLSHELQHPPNGSGGTGGGGGWPPSS